MVRSAICAFWATKDRLVIFGTLLLCYLVWAGLPPSLWMEVRSVRVEDALEGESPPMKVDRVIHREFDARWAVELERLEDDGWSLVTTARGDHNYTVDAVLPKSLDLDWWTSPSVLRPGPGLYRITTCWRVITHWLKDRRMCRSSNLFSIKKAS